MARLRADSSCDTSLTGGDDWGVFPERDETETMIFEFAREHELPLLGVCRGAQVLSHLCGGRLLAARGHAATRHEILFSSGNARIVNSFHNHAISHVGSGLAPIAADSDDNIEAFASDDGLIRGTMWHPEREDVPHEQDIDLVAKMFAAGYARFIVSCSDIVYHPDHVRRLLDSKHDMAITYDIKWLDLWRLRFENVLDDAETFREEQGRLREIGGKSANVAEISGQYMGLLKMTARGWRIWNETCASVDLKKMDMTGFLRQLLGHVQPIGAVPVEGRWCEADSAEDLRRYEQVLSVEGWSHDWREEES